MSGNNYLKQAERKVFRASLAGGLIDVGIASFTLMFAVAPLLSPTLGDFWSSFIFLPFFGFVYLVLNWVRKRYVLPRIGHVTFGAERTKRLRRAGTVMLVFNIIALLLGAFTFFYSDASSWMIALRFSAVMLLFASMVGYLYELPQLYFYGFTFALAIPVGEWFWQQGLASHHGFPLVFGVISAGIFIFGVFKFIRLMRIQALELEA